MTVRNTPVIALVPLDKYDDLIPYFEALQNLIQTLPITTDIVVVKTTSFTVGNEDYILVDDDAAGDDVTINLPPAENHESELKQIKKLGSTGDVVLDGDGTQTIDGFQTQSITAQYNSLSLMSDGSNWNIL